MWPRAGQGLVGRIAVHEVVDVGRDVIPLHAVAASLIVALPIGGRREELRHARHVEIRILLPLEHPEDRMRREHQVRPGILDDGQIARRVLQRLRQRPQPR
mgnify:CR=1 FL=1